MSTPIDFRCPNCNSSDVHHRVTALNPFRCGRCGSEWGALDRPKEPGSGWLSRTFQWCVKHPKQTAIIILVLVTISSISVITDPSAEGVTTGQLVFAWLWAIGTIIFVAIWLTQKIKSRSKQQPEDEVTENESTDSKPPG